MSIKAFGKTDIGKSRTSNEDSFSLSHELHLYVVADGMGGHAAGEVASRMAVDLIQEYMLETQKESDITLPFDVSSDLPPVAQRLVVAGKLANQKIYQLGQSEKKYTGMGTTLVSLIIKDGKAYVSHAGDSRAYLIRNETIQQITPDHSLVNEYVTQGILSEDETAAHPLKHVITRALGSSAQIEMEVNILPVENGDLFLLCSDGLSNPISDQEICTQIKNHPNGLEEGCQHLIDFALEKGADDNITVILINYSN